MGRIAASIFDVAGGGVIISGIFLLFIIIIVVLIFFIFSIIKIFEIKKQEDEINNKNKDD